MISFAIWAVFLAVPAVLSEILMVQIDRTGTKVVYRLQGKQRDTIQLKSTMGLDYDLID